MALLIDVVQEELYYGQKKDFKEQSLRKNWSE